MKILPFLVFSIVVLVYLTAASTVQARTWYNLPNGTGFAYSGNMALVLDQGRGQQPSQSHPLILVPSA